MRTLPCLALLSLCLCKLACVDASDGSTPIPTVNYGNPNTATVHGSVGGTTLTVASVIFSQTTTASDPNNSNKPSNTTHIVISSDANRCTDGTGGAGAQELDITAVGVGSSVPLNGVFGVTTDHTTRPDTNAVLYADATFVAASNSTPVNYGSVMTLEVNGAQSVQGNFTFTFNNDTLTGVFNAISCTGL